MKRIMYLSFNDPDSSPGVLRKEREFCEAFGELCSHQDKEFQGICIAASANGKHESARFGKHLSVKRIPSLPYRMFCRIPLFGSLFRIRPVYAQAYSDIGQFRPDVLIWRFSITTVPGIFNPRQVCPGMLFLSDHQSKELEELGMTLPGRILSSVMERHAKKVLGQVDAVLGVTSEIREYELALAGRDIPSITMTNSIQVEGYPMRKYHPSSDTLRLLYVGSNTAEWHGLDRLLRGLAAYEGRLRLELHIAGVAGHPIREMVRSLNVTDRVAFHGFISGKELDILFDESDLAVGTLGIHRKRLSQGSTLKVREYMARGIPFMISHEDEDLSPRLPYVYSAAPDDSPIDMQGAIRFIQNLRDTHGDGLSAEMRAYALDHMDYQVKLMKLMHFIDSLPSPSGRVCAA